MQVLQSRLQHIHSLTHLKRVSPTACRQIFVTSAAQDRYSLLSTTKAKMSSDYLTLKGQTFERAAFDQLMKRRNFLWQSFEPYGAIKGFYDYGPPLEALEAEVLSIWRDHFIRTEKMMALKCAMVTPYKVFKASGHVDRFADFMCKDTKNGEIIRTDHLIKEVLESRLQGDKEARGQATIPAVEDATKKKKKEVKKVAVKLDDNVVKEYEHILATLDDYTGAAMGELIKKCDIRNPTSGNEVEPPIAVNLMFKTNIGPTGEDPAFLRPETAQGQFLSFQKLFEYSDGVLPFASASIGYSFRNELSPRSGLLRVREFLMAEIEHFVDPESGKKHVKFDSVKDVKLPLLSRTVQSSGNTATEMMSIGDAVANKVVDNETLGYFLVRIFLFMQRIGIDMKKLRFRQHMENEMAHYASDCWDCELLNSYGWTECVGCADRSAYDLTVHEQATGANLKARETLTKPRQIEEFVATPNKQKLGPRFKKDAAAVESALLALTQDIKEKLSLEMKADGRIEIPVPSVAGGKVELTSDLVTIEKQSRTETTREYTPNVIEPSFGIGRILYTLMEHCYWTRANDEMRSVLSFTPRTAPIKVLLVPLQRDARFAPIVSKLETLLDSKSLSYKLDQSGVSIGKRYSRNDELGIPFGITVDYESIDDGTVTLRDRDSTRQVRGSFEEVIKAVGRMVKGKEVWNDVMGRLKVVESSANEE